MKFWGESFRFGEILGCGGKRKSWGLFWWEHLSCLELVKWSNFESEALGFDRNCSRQCSNQNLSQPFKPATDFHFHSLSNSLNSWPVLTINYGNDFYFYCDDNSQGISSLPSLERMKFPQILFMTQSSFPTKSFSRCFILFLARQLSSITRINRHKLPRKQAIKSGGFG
jgi:hypothetical protein